jgi:hypothetical protein
MKVGSAAGVISGLSPGTEKAGEDLWTTYVPNGTMDIIIIKQNWYIHKKHTKTKSMNTKGFIKWLFMSMG